MTMSLKNKKTLKKNREENNEITLNYQEVQVFLELFFSLRYVACIWIIECAKIWIIYIYAFSL